MPRVDRKDSASNKMFKRIHDGGSSQASKRDQACKRRLKRILKLKERRQKHGVAAAGHAHPSSSSKYSVSSGSSCSGTSSNSSEISSESLTAATSTLHSSTSARSSAVIDALEVQRRKNNRISAEVSRRKTLQHEDEWTCKALYFGMLLDDVTAHNATLREFYLVCCSAYNVAPVVADPAAFYASCYNPYYGVGPLYTPMLPPFSTVYCGGGDSNGSGSSVSSMSDEASTNGITVEDVDSVGFEEDAEGEVKTDAELFREEIFLALMTEEEEQQSLRSEELAFSAVTAAVSSDGECRRLGREVDLCGPILDFA